MVVCVTFLRDVARQKLLNSANVSRSYSQNNTGTVFLRHGVDKPNHDLGVSLYLLRNIDHSLLCPDS